VIQLRVLGFVLVLGVVMVAWLLTFGAWQLDRVIAGVAPLDPREFEGFTLVTIGTGGAYENRDRLGPALAIGRASRVVLVDAGRGVAEALRAARIPPSQIETVYLTNLLPENTVGLDDLRSTGWLSGRSTPLRLVGPPGTRALADGITAAGRRGIDARARALGLALEGARLEAVEVAPGFAETIGGISVRAGDLPGGPLAALAWRFEADGRSLAVGGTGWAPEALVDFAQGANVLVHEAVFVPDETLARELGIEDDMERLRREAALHTAIADVGNLAARARVDTLVLVRLRPPPVYDFQLTSVIDDDFGGRVVIATDGQEIRP
jgi:ribonuclease Z